VQAVLKKTARGSLGSRGAPPAFTVDSGEPVMDGGESAHNDWKSFALRFGLCLHARAFVHKICFVLQSVQRRSRHLNNFTFGRKATCIEKLHDVVPCHRVECFGEAQFQDNCGLLLPVATLDDANTRLRRVLVCRVCDE
jgi:hypothetical protein